jgi:hypothetical protein
MLDHEDTHLESMRRRIERHRPAEMSPEAYVDRLRSRIEAFYEHGSCADLPRVTEEIANMRILCLLSLRSKPHF